MLRRERPHCSVAHLHHFYQIIIWQTYNIYGIIYFKLLSTKTSFFSVKILFKIIFCINKFCGFDQSFWCVWLLYHNYGVLVCLIIFYWWWWEMDGGGRMKTPIILYHCNECKVFGWKGKWHLHIPPHTLFVY